MQKRAIAACFTVYAGLTLLLGRHLLTHLSDRVASDLGDPLFNTIVLHWGARHVPWTDAWWQLPIFYPTRDALAFSEHLLGLLPLSAPLDWLTGSALATFNVVTLLTFVLCACAMFALVLRLTGSVAGAFIAGLVFGFAPYRVSQLPHLQMLAAFYAPLALLGLHAFIETGRRRWLVLYGVAWAFQVTANAYLLIYFSVFVALWVAWFVIARARWRDLASITGATLLAVLPLVPLLYRYLVVQGAQGFVRGPGEVDFYSADAAALFCASPRLSLWSWVHVACRPEGELFPGVVLAVIVIAAAMRFFRPSDGPPKATTRGLVIAARTLVILAAGYAAIAASVWYFGPWRLTIAGQAVSSSSAAKPLAVGMLLLAVAGMLRLSIREALRRSPTGVFYLFGAVMAWLLALGPHPRWLDTSIGIDGPFTLLTLLPSGGGVRVPARFWIIAMIGLSVVAGMFVAEITRGRDRRWRAALVVLLAVGVLSDGWMGAIPAPDAPIAVADPRPLVGHAVLELPMDVERDIAAQYRAVTGGWKSVNGYSGYLPHYYYALLEAVQQETDGALTPFQTFGELDVVVANDAPRLVALLERQPGVEQTARDARVTQFRLPARPWPGGGDGERVPIARLESTCAAPLLDKALDHDVTTRWQCGPLTSGKQLVIDLGAVRTAGAILHDVGPNFGDFPRALTIESSEDGATWAPAWSGDTLGATMIASMRTPRSLPILLPFPPRPARYLRLAYPAQPNAIYWSIGELEVRSR